MPADGTFGTIALCLSGGGYRAAAFHFGAIDMLRELDLLENVKMISTVSGGTIVGAFYALNRIENKDYIEDYYKKFYKFLKNVNAVDDALERLYQPDDPRSLSIIRSASEVYNLHLFDDKTFDLMLKGTETGEPFKELIFNTTEFRVGQSFRFRASHKERFTIGSSNYRIKEDVVKQARLADIVAASSCFPSVFEPMRFPDDFVWEKSLAEIRNELKSGFRDENGDFKKDKNKKHINVPLMDGGIFDNQGIDSLMKADVTKVGDDEEEFEADLFIVSDSTPSDKVVFEMPPKQRKGWFSLQTIWYFIMVLFVASLISSVGLIKYLSDFVSSGKSIQNEFPYFFFVLLLPLTLTILFNIGLFFVIKYKSEYNTLEMQGQTFHLWESIKSLTIYDAVDLGLWRIKSLIVLSANIFLRRIRLMLSTKIKSDDNFTKRVAFNYIYDLNPKDDRPSLWNADEALRPTDEMKNVAQLAAEYPTNLWFSNEKALRSVIVCGQISLCFSILRHLIEELGTIPADPSSPNWVLYQEVKAKWMELKKNPLKYYRNVD
jgi:predicted acylesterase/phospholipase RssA